jgi:BirA family transcriptional regulator, biotin operon repressor / biotin---[acetyl-CoA-carboxylase] ligase
MKLKKFNFKSVNSTNDTAIRIIKNSNFKNGIVITKKQTNGRGQYGKKWISQKDNLFVSIFFSLNEMKYNLKKLTNINCLILKKLLSNYYKKRIIIKKPNDLLINKKKISGILQEIIYKSGKTYVIVGIGINLVSYPKISNYPTTSLYDLTKIKFKKNRIENNLKNIYEKYIPKIPKLVKESSYF